LSTEATREQAVRPPATEPAGPAVGLRGVRRTYGAITAVDDLTLDIPDGEFFALIGPSGCGKTTTLRILAGLEEPTQGEVWLHNKDVTFVPPHRRAVSTVFQNYALFPHLSVFENVAFGLRERKLPKAQIADRVREMLQLVELSGREDVRPAQLSGGQQQRVALARSLVLEPEVLLLDEPLGALDLKLRRQMQLLLKRVQRQVGITFIYVTHDQEEAFSMSDRVGVMNQGRLEQLGSPELVYRCPETMFVADFVGSINRFPGRIAEVLDGDSYVVELEGIGRTEMRGVAGLGAGAAIVAIVRPEMIRPARAEDGGPLVTGQIRDVSFLGPHTSYLVDVGTDAPITVTVPLLGDDEQSGEGTRSFTWPVEAAWVLPAGP
jgi:spermidine/putrescine transport system ATP-binding protein